MQAKINDGILFCPMQHPSRISYKKIAEDLKIPVIIAENPLECVVNGIGKVMEKFEKYKEVLISPETDY